MKNSINFETIKNDKTDILDKYYNDLYENQGFNGSVLVAEKGNIIYQNSFGVKDIETNEKIDLDTIFDIASVTKQFTAAGIMLLVRENKIALSELIPISETVFVAEDLSPEQKYIFSFDDSGKIVKCNAQNLANGIDITLYPKKN